MVKSWEQQFDPIPANLAKHECSVDVDSLVTVTKKMSNIQPRPLAKAVTKQKLKNPIEKKSTEVFQRQKDKDEDDRVKMKRAKRTTTTTAITTRKTIDKNREKLKSASPSNDLSTQLSKYLNLLGSETSGRLENATVSISAKNVLEDDESPLKSTVM
ncbi:unnamed protein product [Trichobilharzia regenti]|nr:unnamed protein product [Trichobilharzia regenti]